MFGMLTQFQKIAGLSTLGIFVLIGVGRAQTIEVGPTVSAVKAMPGQVLHITGSYWDPQYQSKTGEAISLVKEIPSARLYSAPTLNIITVQSNVTDYDFNYTVPPVGGHFTFDVDFSLSYNEFLMPFRVITIDVTGAQASDATEKARTASGQSCAATSSQVKHGESLSDVTTDLGKPDSTKTSEGYTKSITYDCLDGSVNISFDLRENVTSVSNAR
jgi:hypothetical protein